jgi:uncharacterized membrane protein
MSTLQQKRVPYSGGLVGVGVLSALLLLGLSIFIFFLLRQNKGKIISDHKTKKTSILSLSFSVLSILIVILLIILYVL